MLMLLILYKKIECVPFANAAHPLQNCRLYYSQITMEPQHARTYSNSNTNKKVIYRTFVTNNYPATPAGGSFNQLINSGIVLVGLF